MVAVVIAVVGINVVEKAVVEIGVDETVAGMVAASLLAYYFLIN
jgi:hypothetical protein